MGHLNTVFRECSPVVAMAGDPRNRPGGPVDFSEPNWVGTVSRLELLLL